MKTNGKRRKKWPMAMIEIETAHSCCTSSYLIITQMTQQSHNRIHISDLVVLVKPFIRQDDSSATWHVLFSNTDVLCYGEFDILLGYIATE